MSNVKKLGDLIVDDALFIRVKIKKILNKITNVEVVGEASNGSEAVYLYKKLKPGLVTMDLVMPDKGGIDAIEEILKFDKGANIVVVSALGQEELILEATEKGAKDFIRKPFEDEDFTNVIKNFITA